MSVEEIKKGLIALSEAEQSEVTAFLFHLRHSHDPDYQDVVSARLSDADSSHWVTPEQFEKQLNQRWPHRSQIRGFHAPWSPRRNPEERSPTAQNHGLHLQSARLSLHSGRFFE